MAGNGERWALFTLTHICTFCILNHENYCLFSKFKINIILKYNF